mgnify:CR=1 FL=1
MSSKGLDFKHKEVVNITDGKRLGFVQDVTADLNSGIITSIIVPGNSKLFNIFSGNNRRYISGYAENVTGISVCWSFQRSKLWWRRRFYCYTKRCY